MSIPGETVLDACCTLTLCATGRIEEILQMLPRRFLIGQRARAEAQWLKSEGSDEREQVNLEPLIEAGLIQSLSLQAHDENALFVELAAVMEDGEAEAAAIAIHHTYALATDERKVRRILQAKHPTLSIVSTPELLYEWQSERGLNQSELGEMLRRVSARASFAPPRGDLRRDWWLEYSK